MLATEAAISEMNAMAMVAKFERCMARTSSENKMSHAVEGAAGCKMRSEILTNS